MQELISERPAVVVEALLKSPRGVETLLSHGAGVGLQQERSPEPIVILSAFGRVHVARWLALLDAGDLPQLRDELRAELAPENGEAS